MIHPSTLSPFFLLFTAVSCEYPPFDGRGNNIANPEWGAAGSPYSRIQAPAAYSDGVSAVSCPDCPSALQVSGIVSPAKNRLVSNKQRLNDLLPFWGQFLAHDILITPNDPILNFTIAVPSCLSDPVPCDSIDQPITLKRAASAGLVDGSRAILNGITSYIDASQVYGSSLERSNLLRELGTPYLRTQNQGKFMPSVLDDTSMAGTHPRRFLAGDVRANENPVLQSLHTLLVREHNRKADEIFFENPRWSNEQIFQEARKWVIAVMQRISVYEYLPALLGEQLPQYKGYNASANSAIDTFFMAASFRYGHSAINPVILRLTEKGESHPFGHLLLRDSFFNPLPVFEADIEPILRGCVLQADSEVDAVVIDDLRKFFFAQPFDLVAVNTMRGRDVGIPSYNEARRALGLAPAVKWSDITSSQDLASRLRDAYGDIEKVDAYIGGLSEDHVDGSILGPLFHTSIKEQFVRLRDGDRFWYEGEDLRLSPTDKDLLSSMTLSQLITLNSDIDMFPSSAFAVPDPEQFQFAGLTVSTSGAISASSGEKRLSTGLSMRWTVEEDNIEFVLQSNYSGWFAIGFGSNGMVDADMIICLTEAGTFSCDDYWSDGNVTPQLDIDRGGSSDLTDFADITASEVFHTRAVRFKRNLETGDSRDASLLSPSVEIIYAYSDSAELSYHGAANRGSALVSFTSSASPISDSQFLSRSARAEKVYFIVHGCIMGISFFIFAPSAIFVARNPSRYSNWLERHKEFMKFLIHLAIVDVVVVSVSSYAKGTSYTHYYHARIGYSLVGLMALNATLGYLIRNVDIMSVINTQGIRKGHLIVGWTTFLLGLINCSFGLRDIAMEVDPNHIAAYVLGGISVCIVAFLIGSEKILLMLPYGGKSKDGKLRFFGSGTPGARKNRNLASFDWPEIHYRIEKGAHWIVIGGLIYDVQDFKSSHPGGSQILSYCYGIDSTSIFTGKKPLSQFKDVVAGQKRSVKITKSAYRHSRVATAGLSDLAVGVLSDNFVSNVVNYKIVSPNEYIPIVLSGKELDSRSRSGDVYKFTFDFPNPKWSVQFRPGESILLRLVVAGRIVTRFYSPIEHESLSRITLLVRVYSNGLLTSVLGRLPLSAEIHFRGPFKLTPEANNPHSLDGCWNHLGLIGAGTGVAPMLLFLDYHLAHLSFDSDGKPSVSISLVVVASEGSAVIGEDRLEEYEENFKGALTVYRVHSTLSKDEETERIRSGRINASLLKEWMPLNSAVEEYREMRSAHDLLSSEKLGHDGAERGSIVSPQLRARTNVQAISSTLKTPNNITRKEELTPRVRDRLAEAVVSGKAQDELRIFISGNTDFLSDVSEMLLDVGYMPEHICPLSNHHSLYALRSKSSLQRSSNHSRATSGSGLQRSASLK